GCPTGIELRQSKSPKSPCSARPRPEANTWSGAADRSGVPRTPASATSVRPVSLLLGADGESDPGSSALVTPRFRLALSGCAVVLRADADSWVEVSAAEV